MLSFLLVRAAAGGAHVQEAAEAGSGGRKRRLESEWLEEAGGRAGGGPESGP